MNYNSSNRLLFSSVRNSKMQKEPQLFLTQRKN